MQKESGIYYNKIIYCYIEKQDYVLNEFILKYDTESIIHVVPDIIDSCESRLFYCLCDIVTNYIESSKEQEKEFWFVTDVEELYIIVQKLYPMLFEKIIYIEQKINKKFMDGFEVEEFITYFLDIQRSKLQALFMKRLWALKDCRDINEFTNFLYELNELDIKNESSLSKLWCCFCGILLYELECSNLKRDCFNYKLSLYSILMVLEREPVYINIYLSEVLENKELTAENIYFVWYQYKRIFLKKIAVFNEETSALCEKIYDKCYDKFLIETKGYLERIPMQKRDKNLIIITAIQFLDETHAPTRTVIERAKALKKSGKKVIIVNTTEQYIMRGYLPMFNTGFGRILEEYENINEINIGGNIFPFIQMPENSPMQYRIKILSELLNKYKPYYILSIGTGSILADLCGNIVPCASMALAFSTLPKTKNKMKILGRKLNREEKKIYSGGDIDIIESRFTFELRPQKKEFSRKEKGLPKDKFIIVVVGIRLEFEINKAFMDMLTDVCESGCYIVFAGIMNNYNTLMKNYPIVSCNSSFIGYCDDILALMGICDLYVNPDRLGGGFSIIEAFSKGIPGVYLKSGDVYIAGGEEFAVNNFDEMAKQILRYKNDTDYYNIMSELAKNRAKFMTSSNEAIEDIDRQICQRIEEKYW